MGGQGIGQIAQHADPIRIDVEGVIARKIGKRAARAREGCCEARRRLSAKDRLAAVCRQVIARAWISAQPASTWMVGDSGASVRARCR